MRKMYSKKQIEEIAKSSGTKLYKHYLHDSNLGYKFILITTNPEPIDFSIINTYSKLHEYLIKENVLGFFDENNNGVMYDGSVKTSFYTIYIREIQNVPVCCPSYYDDWSLSDTTDTISPL